MSDVQATKQGQVVTVRVESLTLSVPTNSRIGMATSPKICLEIDVLPGGDWETVVFEALKRVNKQAEDSLIAALDDIAKRRSKVLEHEVVQRALGGGR